MEVIAHSRATRVYIANLMTQPGETQGYSVADHVRAIDAHCERKLFDAVVVSRAPVSQRIIRRYKAEGAEPVRPSLNELRDMGLKAITGDLLHQHGVVRHDPERLASLLIKEFVTSKVVALLLALATRRRTCASVTPRTSTVSQRFRSPVRILTADLGVPKRPASNSARAALARFSRAGAPSLTFIARSITPATSSRMARGCARTIQITVPLALVISLPAGGFVSLIGFKSMKD